MIPMQRPGQPCAQKLGWPQHCQGEAFDISDICTEAISSDGKVRTPSIVSEVSGCLCSDTDNHDDPYPFAIPDTSDLAALPPREPTTTRHDNTT